MYTYNCNKQLKISKTNKTIIINNKGEKIRGEGEKRKFCGSRLANQSFKKESFKKSNGFASKPTESHSFPRLLILTLHLSLSLFRVYICIICLYINYITFKIGNARLASKGIHGNCSRVRLLKSPPLINTIHYLLSL